MNPSALTTSPSSIDPAAPAAAPPDPIAGFPAVTWADDLAARVGPAVLTQLLRDAVPVLGWVDWRITRLDEGAVESVLPLNDEATNQHGTHQAALFGLAADYTGGAALLSLLRGVPALGVHPLLDAEACAMWLVGLQVSYLLPSAAPLTIRAAIDPARWPIIRDLYLRGRTVIEEVELAFFADGERVATGTCRYFLKRASRLEPTELAARPNPIFAHKSKASARLIAGVRAAEHRLPAPRIEDPWAEALAGPHGAFLARRFSATLPPLRDMVVARTVDADRLVRDRVAAGVAQVVLVGVGYDMRPFRLLAGTDVEVFELDLPHMLADRARLLAGLTLPPVRRTAVPFNLRLTSLTRALAATSFRADRPAVFVIEGVSMYQSEPIMRALLDDLSVLLGDPASVAWMDTAAARVLAPTGVAAVDDFIAGMQRLGEPFTFGVDEPVSWLAGSALAARRVAVDGADPIFGFYDFLHVTRAS